MYRFARRPLWILSHLFAASMIVLFISLGLWQLRRHDERVERNATVVARTELPAASVDAVLADTPDLESARFRTATVRGTFGNHDLLVDNRSDQGLPGVWVLTPLIADDGSIVVVNRGFEGYVSGELTLPAPPPGEVEVTGTLVPWVGRSCGTRTDDGGRVIGMACLRRSGAEEAFGAPVEPVVVQALDAVPAGGALRPVPLPELGSGPHRGYAGQWFIFATIIAIVYVLILRRVARDRSIEDRPGPGGAPDRSTEKIDSSAWT